MLISLSRLSNLGEKYILILYFRANVWNKKVLFVYTPSEGFYSILHITEFHKNIFIAYLDEI
jgi:hypothetical protein